MDLDGVPLTPLLLRLWCSLALVLSALPMRAGTVCVDGGRVVAPCPMARAGKAGMPCCHPKGGGGSLCLKARPGAHCASAYRAADHYVDPAKLKVPLAALAPSLNAVLTAPIEFEPSGPAPKAIPPRPPGPRPRAPDRGRAPPPMV